MNLRTKTVLAAVLASTCDAFMSQIGPNGPKCIKTSPSDRVAFVEHLVPCEQSSPGRLQGNSVELPALANPELFPSTTLSFFAEYAFANFLIPTLILSAGVLGTIKQELDHPAMPSGLSSRYSTSVDDESEVADSKGAIDSGKPGESSTFVEVESIEAAEQPVVNDLMQTSEAMDASTRGSADGAGPAMPKEQVDRMTSTSSKVFEEPEKDITALKTEIGSTVEKQRIIADRLVSNAAQKAESAARLAKDKMEDAAEEAEDVADDASEDTVRSLKMQGKKRRFLKKCFKKVLTPWRSWSEL